MSRIARVMIPQQAYQALDEAVTRTEGLEKAAPWIIWQACKFIVGERVTLLAFLWRKAFIIGIGLAIGSLWTEVGTKGHWVIGGVVALIVADVVASFGIQRRITRRAVVFAQQKPEYWT